MDNDVNELDEEVDELISFERSNLNNSSDASLSQQLLPINKNIFFRTNSVNCVIGKRSSGKTYLILREVLKCCMVCQSLNLIPYTQLWYISDKMQGNDETVNLFEPLLSKYIQFNYIATKDALQLFQAIELGKSILLTEPDNEEVLQSLNATSGIIPHTFIIFDDCIHLFSKPTELSKKLFQNRQSRTTIFLILQDVNGLSSSVKSNLDSLVLFGGFSSQKYNVLTYQLPPSDFTFKDYSCLNQREYVLFDFNTNETQTSCNNNKLLPTLFKRLN